MLGEMKSKRVVKPQCKMTMFLPTITRVQFRFDRRAFSDQNGKSRVIFLQRYILLLDEVSARCKRKS